MELVVEHGSSRSGRWLRRHRTRIALWIAVVEAALILFGVVPLAPAVVVALGLIALYVLVGRRWRSDAGRQLTWIGAVSQLVIAVLPLVVAAVTLAALVAAIVVLAVALALAVLFLRRR